MNAEQVNAEVTQIFRDLFDDDSIVLTPDTTAKDISGWDSYKHVTLLVALEQNFGIRFKSREIDGLARVGDLIELVVFKKLP